MSQYLFSRRLHILIQFEHIRGDMFVWGSGRKIEKVYEEFTDFLQLIPLLIDTFQTGSAAYEECRNTCIELFMNKFFQGKNINVLVWLQRGQ